MDRRFALVGSLIFGIVGCSRSEPWETARTRSAYDLNCAPEKIHLRRGIGGVIVAEGCGEWVSYGCVQSRPRGEMVCIRDDSSIRSRRK